ncbi:MAG: sugar phosphate isomerase/epimerase [Victivallaceae bacterium]
MKPISVQLYSLRAEAEKDFVGVLKRLAKIGYKGVEPAGFWNLTPKELKKIVTDLGMKISSTHSPWANPQNLNQVIEVAGELDIDLVACGYGPAEFKDMNAIKATADMVNGMQEKLAAAGITLFQHNHYWEFDKIDGRIIYDIYAELCPKVKFELDTYWAANFGQENAAEQVKKFKDRCVLLHIKDGALIKGGTQAASESCKDSILEIKAAAMVAVGSGSNNIKEIIAAADEKVTRWMIVELDRCATDMFGAIEQSYKYLTSKGLASGNK